MPHTQAGAQIPTPPSTFIPVRFHGEFGMPGSTDQLLGKRDGLSAHHPDRLALRALVIEQNLTMATRLARRYAGRGESLDDLAQVAATALVKAVDGYDSSRGVPFVGYAIPSIVGALKRHFRDAGWGMRVPRATKELILKVRTASSELGHRLGRPPTSAELADHLDVTLDNLSAAEAARHAYRPDSLDASPVGPDGVQSADLVRPLSEIDPRFAAVEDRLMLRALVATLPERDRRIVRMRFYDELSQTQIADRIGVSQMQVSRLLRQCLTRLQLVANAPTARSSEPMKRQAGVRR